MLSKSTTRLCLCAVPICRCTALKRPGRARSIKTLKWFCFWSEELSFFLTQLQHLLLQSPFVSRVSFQLHNWTREIPCPGLSVANPCLLHWLASVLINAKCMHGVKVTDLHNGAPREVWGRPAEGTERRARRGSRERVCLDAREQQVVSSQLLTPALNRTERSIVKTHGPL